MKGFASEKFPFLVQILTQKPQPILHQINLTHLNHFSRLESLSSPLVCHSSSSQLPPIPSSATSGIPALSLFLSLFFFFFLTQINTVVISRMVLYLDTIYPSPSHTHTFIQLMLNGEDFIFVERFSHSSSISQLFSTHTHTHFFRPFRILICNTHSFLLFSGECVYPLLFTPLCESE